MAKKLTTEQKEVLNSFLEEKGLLGLINDYLETNGLTEFEVDSVRIKQKDHAKFRGPCPEGFTRVQVCTDYGRCVWECIKVE